MISCCIHYRISPKEQDAFEQYAKLWIPLVNKFGGIHHGYFLPHEGANNKALAIFSFPTLAEYEQYRILSLKDSACKEAYSFAEKSNCIISYKRTFMKPILS